MKFQKSLQYKHIKKEMDTIGLLNKKAKFQCSSDGIYVYQIKADGALHELQIITEKDVFAKERVKTLLEMDLSYFSHSIYLIEDNEKRIASIDWVKE